MTNSPKKQSKRDIKELEQALIEKANREELTFSEKQEYETLVQRIRKRRRVINQAIIGGFIIAALAGAMLYVKYGKPNLLIMSVPDQKITYFEVNALTNRTSEELLQKIEAHIERNNEVNNYYNEALKQYDEEGAIQDTFIENIEKLKSFDDAASIKGLDSIFKDIADKRIEVLNNLNNGDTNLFDIEKNTEEIERLNDTYMQAIVYMLQKEKIKCKPVPGGVKIYH